MARSSVAVMRRAPVVTPFVETHTANYGWTKPEVGASMDAWGDMINADLDSIDAIVHGLAVGASQTAMQAMTITVANTFSPTAHVPNMQMFVLYINGRAFFPVGTAPDFSVSGSTITWLSTIFSVAPGSTVVAVYSWNP